MINPSEQTINSVIKRLTFLNKTVTLTSQIPTFLLWEIEANYIYLFSKASPLPTQKRHPTVTLIGRIFSLSFLWFYSSFSKGFRLFVFTMNHWIVEQILLPHLCQNQPLSWSSL